jgi:hypothetical protein
MEEDGVMRVYVAGPMKGNGVDILSTGNDEVYDHLQSVLDHLKVEAVIPEPVFFPKPVLAEEDGAYFAEIVARIRRSDAVIVFAKEDRPHEPIEMGIAGVLSKKQLVITNDWETFPRLLRDMPQVQLLSVKSLPTHDEEFAILPDEERFQKLDQGIRAFIGDVEASEESTMVDELRRLNVKITDKEMEGNKAFFDDLLAPTFAFRRANGAFEDRQIFLAGLKEGGAQRKCDPNSIEITLLGGMRAFVTCIVKMKIDTEWKAFHNARLFVLDFKDWRLLAWTNEAVAP